MQQRNVYALLVGIDAYHLPVAPLRGCVRDIQSIEQLLRTRTNKPGVDFKPLLLLDQHATREAVIDGFLKHLSLAGPQDVALFYYAGHGSQERTPPEFWHLEPDRLDETLVCVDSRDPGQYDLADKEISKLIAEVAKNGAHTLVVLDSCHSGSGTRDAGTSSVRRVPADTRERPISSFLVTPSEADALLGDARALNRPHSMVTMPKGRHVLMAACQSNEEAREVVIDGQTRGVFSHFLVDAIEQATGMPTYRDLAKRVNALVRLQVSGQYPLLETTDQEDMDLPFLGGNVVEHQAYYTVTLDAVDGWIIDAGALHGIAQPVDDETTQLALFKADAIDMRKLGSSVGRAKVTATLPARSKVELALDDGSPPDRSSTFKAIAIALPLPPLKVTLQGDPICISIVRAALSSAGPGGTAPSLLVKESESSGELRVDVTPDRIRISLPADERPLCADLGTPSADSARKLVARLEHVARWRRIASLTNPATKLAPNAVEMTVIPIDQVGATLADGSAPAGSRSQLRFDYRFVDGSWKPSQFKVRLVNKSDRRLYCMLLALSQTYGITSDLMANGGVWLDRGEEAWAFNGDAVTAWLPDELWKGGVAETNDILKLVISTEQSDATLLNQPDLDMPHAPVATTRSTGSSNSLERLFGRVQTRALGAGPSSSGRIADWRTTELAIVTARPLEGVPISASDSVEVVPGLQIQAHPTFRAIARLATLPAAGRSATLAPLPPILLEDPSVAQSFEFIGSRNGEPGLSVLELQVDSVDADLAVSSEQPLSLNIQAPLGPTEHLLPIGFDGEFYIPLGSTKRVNGSLVVTLDRLPKAVSTRSLTSAIRILFQKIAGETLGTTYRYPLLTAVDADGRRTDDSETLCGKIAAASRLLLYVHGIIGDTQAMAASAFVPLPALDGGSFNIGEAYDLVLAFDYENLKTPIEETAQDLKRRLAEVGLGAAHGKTLHVVAHSMGGLVARWFIECEGGDAVVQRLVMLGTPNAGSPWPTVENWATTALALGLNGLTTVAWPAKVLSGLVSAVECVDVTLDQMEADSSLLKTLAASADPGVPYTIFAGNTSTILPVSGEAQRTSLVARLLERLSPSRLLHEVTSLAFFKAPNDIAVSVASIGAIPPGRRQPPDITEVASDHISYFTTPSVLQRLHKALL